ncbi:unnamed protein product, partial [Symbiodinium sp. CCMP2456]
VSLHLLPSFVDELRRPPAASDPVPRNEDIVLARQLEKLKPDKLNLHLLLWKEDCRGCETLSFGTRSFAANDSTMASCRSI